MKNLSAFVVGAIRSISDEDLASIRSMSRDEIVVALWLDGEETLRDIDAALSAYSNHVS